MKTKILSILALLLTVTQGAWAQTTADIGRVIAADGKMYKTVTLANKVSTASGVVAYVGAAGSVATLTGNDADDPNSSTYKCIAISLANIATATAWCPNPTLWFAGKDLTSALSDLNGITYTTIFGRPGSRDIGTHNHQAAAAVYDYATARPTGASRWFIPSMGQWKLVAQGLTGKSSVISDKNAKNADYSQENLNAKITSAGASGLTWALYWSSNESSANAMWFFAIEGNSAGGSYAGFTTKDETEYMWTRGAFCFASASNGYVVEYNANGGSGAPAAQSKTHGTALTLSSTVPTRTGYTFAGWATSAEGAVAYSAGGSYTTDNDIVLYAQWTPTYTATFATGNDNDGWTIEPTSGVEGATVTVSYSGENKVKSVTVQAKPICALSAVTSAHVGKVIGADGNVYNTVAQANTATTACGVIAYVGAAGEVHSAYAAHKGIAVSLDETLLAYSTVNEDLDSPTSDFATVLTWKNGEFTTNAAVAKGTYPAFTWAAGHNTTPGRVSGASAWFLPSVGQWNLAVRGMTGSNTDLKEGSSNANSNMDRDKLNVVLNAAGASPLGVGNYMMATEYSTTEFWEYIYLGYFDHMGKSAAFAVRPIFTF